MNDLKSMRAFVAVARHGSFVAAAKRLGISTSSVSRLIMDLEDWLGTPVLRRSPRQVALTDAGERFLDRCIGILGDVDSLKEDAVALTGTPRGTLNVAAAAHPMQKRISPLIPEFLEMYPDISLNFHLQNEQVDLIAEGIDVAIRIGDLSDSALISRRCGETKLLLTASPGFIDKHGAPETLQAVPSYPCLSDMIASFGRRWPIGRSVEVDGPVSANDGEVIRQMTLAGLGISFLPDFVVEDDIEEGRLISLFPDETNVRLGFYLLYPATRSITSAVRVFVDFISQNLRPQK
jgi:DNA-binding transcriptional LysR family regulator